MLALERKIKTFNWPKSQPNNDVILKFISLQNQNICMAGPEREIYLTGTGLRANQILSLKRASSHCLTKENIDTNLCLRKFTCYN